MNLNHPAWSPALHPDRGKTKQIHSQKGFQEVWYLKLNQPATQSALWLRFTLLVSENGFRRVAETWAVHFQRNAQRDVTKVALKQTHDVTAFSHTLSGDGQSVIRIGENWLSSEGTQGKIESKAHSIRWDLKMRTALGGSFDMVPELLHKTKLVKNNAVTVAEGLLFSGTAVVDGQTFEIQDAPGMQGHLSGPRNGHSWIWGQCSAFVNEQGIPVPFIFEGLTAKALVMGKVPAPKISAFYFFYMNQTYAFNTLRNVVRLRSENSLTQWRFEAHRGDVSFRGEISSEHKDFAGLTYEDTNGSLLYCSNSKLSDLKIHVYRNSKLEATFYGNGTAAFEVVSRIKNPYVPLLI